MKEPRRSCEATGLLVGCEVLNLRRRIFLYHPSCVKHGGFFNG